MPYCRDVSFPRQRLVPDLSFGICVKEWTKPVKGGPLLGNEWNWTESDKEHQIYGPS